MFFHSISTYVLLNKTRFNCLTDVSKFVVIVIEGNSVTFELFGFGTVVPKKEAPDDPYKLGSSHSMKYVVGLSEVV